MSKIARNIRRFGQSIPEPIPDNTPKLAAELQCARRFERLPAHGSVSERTCTGTRAPPIGR